MQKHKIQKDVQIKHCFYPQEKEKVVQIVYLDLDGPLSSTREGFKYILGIVDNFSAFVMAMALKGKTHEEVMEAFTDNWTHRIGASEFLV